MTTSQKTFFAVDPCVDCVFKAILGSEQHDYLLIHFLESVLALEGARRITQIEIGNPYIPKLTAWSKGAIVDIRARDQLKRDFQIEIQIRRHDSLIQRMLHNWSGLYQEKLPKGKNWSELCPVIGIWLMVEDLMPEVENDHLIFELHCRQASRPVTDHLEIHVFQLSKWKEGITLTDRDRWLRFFREGKQLNPDRLPQWMQTPVMRKAMSIARQFESNEQREIYLARVRAEITENTFRMERDRAVEKLNRTEAKLDQTEAKLDQTEAKLDQTEAKLDQTEVERDTTKAELDQTAVERDQALEKADRNEAELRRVLVELEAYKTKERLDKE